ncbi:MAG: hypothetical protein ACRD23_07015, partial [Terriglobales bacterium]
GASTPTPRERDARAYIEPPQRYNTAVPASSQPRPDQPSPQRPSKLRIHKLEAGGILIIGVLILLVTLIRYWHHIAWGVR